MKKKYKFLLISTLIFIAWLIFSAFQPAIIIGESDNWKATYKPRKGTAADSISYPWKGTIEYKGTSKEPVNISVDLLDSGKYINNYMTLINGTEIGDGNFDGKRQTDYETFYNGPDKSTEGMRIRWQENGKSHTESFKFKRKKRLLVMPLVFPLF
ncbi:Uncharacterised protein [Listeria grayi]|nr:hypothetical protein [Listeria grayi]VEI32878.1 Uncharacterised protein [Listeria grayi]